MGISVEGLVKSYRNFRLGELNFSVKDGEYFVLLGPSGSGKTKTIEFIAGLDIPDSGIVTGINRKKIGFIYQDYMLFPHLNVVENISYGLKIRNLSKSEIGERINSISEYLGIERFLTRRVSELSGGEKQRVAIARAMVIYPDVYILDEPTSSLDKNLKSKAQSFFRDIHKKTGKTFIHVTHDFEEALSLGDRIAVIFDGKIVQTGSPDKLYSEPVSGKVADFIGYRNVYSGEIRNYSFKYNDLEIGVPFRDSDKAYIAVLPDDILLSGKEFRSSARNSFRGKVKTIIPKVSSVEVIVDIGLPMSVEITRKSFVELGVKEGDEYCVTFKVSSVKVFER